MVRQHRHQHQAYPQDRRGKRGKEGFDFGSDFDFGWEEEVRLHRELEAEDGKLVDRLVDLGFGPEVDMVGSWALLDLDLRLHRRQVRGLQVQPHREQLRKWKQEPPKAGY